MVPVYLRFTKIPDLNGVTCKEDAVWLLVLLIGSNACIV